MWEPAAAMEDAPSDPLAPGEPGPYDIVNPEGDRPVVLICDHATRFIPRALANLGLDEAQLARHIAWDIGIADVTRDLARRLGAPAVLSHFSRLIVDPNRNPDDPTLIPQISDGAVIPGNRGLTPADREARLARFFRPYHDAVDRLIDQRMARGPAPAIISMHSFTPVMKGVERPWPICALWNRDPRLPLPFMAKLRAQGILVGDNEPYSGREEHGHSLHVHAEPRGLASLLIEIRQDVIDTHHGAAEWTERLAAVLSEILTDPGIYKSSIDKAEPRP
jgi:predicted N-formylglutamate amidohydrolase